jgi:arsenate reductase (thioredoxin)
VLLNQGRVDGRFVDVIAKEKLLKPLVLFVCKHNTGRSQMAEAFLRHFAGDAVDVASAGTIPADRPDPGVVAAMAEVGIDISAARPKLLDPAVLQRADLIVTMGCDVEGVSRIDEDWGLPDPKGQTPARLREIRDLVSAKALALADRYSPTASARTGTTNE